MIQILKLKHLQILREDLCSVLADLDKKDDSILEEAARLVRMARNDYKVWKGGLVQTLRSHNFTFGIEYIGKYVSLKMYFLRF